MLRSLLARCYVDRGHLRRINNHFYVPKLTVCHHPKLTVHHPKLPSHPNVPKNYQCRTFQSGKNPGLDNSNDSFQYSLVFAKITFKSILLRGITNEVCSNCIDSGTTD